jgi:hypothetical protein
MNIDDLKQAWQEQDRLVNKKFTEADLMQLLQKPSISPLGKMKRNLTTELWFIIISFSSMSIYYFISFGTKHIFIPIIYIVFGMLFLFYYRYKIKLLNNILCVSCEIKSNLNQQINTLEKLVRNYLFFATILGTIAIFLIFTIEYYIVKASFLNNSILVYSEEKSVLLYVFTWLIIILFFNQLNYWANKWYMNKLYGKHIKRIKELLEQLNEE